MIDKMMKSLWLKVIVAIGLVCVAVLYLHMRAEHKQAQRELEYRMAHQRVAAEKKQRLQEWETRLEEQRLRQQYSSGSIVNTH